MYVRNWALLHIQLTTVPLHVDTELAEPAAYGPMTPTQAAQTTMKKEKTWMGARSVSHCEGKVAS